MPSKTDNTNGPLAALEDQQTVIAVHSKKPIPFEKAVDQVMAAHKADAARADMDLWKKAPKKLVKDTHEEIEYLQVVGLSKGQRDEVAKALLPAEAESVDDALKGLKSNVYDIANAITLSAQSRPTVDSRLTFEEAAYRYLRRRVN